MANEDPLSLQPGGTWFLQPGNLLQSRYRIIEVEAMGGMGAVYKATDRTNKRLCAVKQVIWEQDQDPSVRKQLERQFEREAELLATLTFDQNQSAIPTIYDFFSFGSDAFIVMEYVNGQTLETLLVHAATFFPLPQVLDWAIQICDALSLLHGADTPIVFRDLKPANIMLDVAERIRLIDFGIALMLSREGQPSTMIGTRGYAPPEITKGVSTPLGDIYGLGATLHHLLSLQDPRFEPPFSFKDRPIRESDPEVPERVERIVMRAVEVEPAARFPSAALMKQALLEARQAI